MYPFNFHNVHAIQHRQATITLARPHFGTHPYKAAMPTAMAPELSASIRAPNESPCSGDDHAAVRYACTTKLPAATQPNAGIERRETAKPIMAKITTGENTNNPRDLLRSTVERFSEAKSKPSPPAE